MKRTSRTCKGGTWLILILLISAGAFAQPGGRPARSFVAGELLLTVPGGTLRATVDELAASVNANVIYAFGPIDLERKIDCYHLRIRGAQVADEVTLQAINKLQADPRVKGAWKNRILRPLRQTGGATAIPNDPRFGDQWNLQQINMPRAWTLEKGQDGVILAVVDTGLDLTHPEFPAARIISPYDAIDDDNNPTPTDNSTHGTEVTGIAIAQANNAIGIAGVVWERVFLMPIRAGTDAGGFTGAALLRAYQHVNNVKNTSGKKVVLNLSLGTADTTDSPNEANLAPDDLALLNLARSGVVVAAGAGNDFENGNPPFSPANLATLSQNILCVAATNHLGARAYYSHVRPYTTIAAPGGDDRAGRLILSTTLVSQGSFADVMGTSMATPHVSGAAALLLSVPGVQPESVRSILTSTAQRVSGFPVPSPQFGHGILDVHAALQSVAISVTIVEPEGTGGKVGSGGPAPPPVETLRPAIRIQVSKVPPDRLSVSVDGTNVPITEDMIVNVQSTVPGGNGGQIPDRYEVLFYRDLEVGRHTVSVTGTQPGPPTVTVSDTRSFTIALHPLPSGRAMISIPYFEDINGDGHSDATPEAYLGSDFRLARWVPTPERVEEESNRTTVIPPSGSYAFYASFGVREPGASFQPPDVQPRQEGSSIIRYPLGLAYWIDANTSIPVRTRGMLLTDRPIVLPLKGTASSDRRFLNWYMLGDPFNFDVPFNSLLVDTPEGRLPIGTAAERGYILPHLYSYDPTIGYTFRTLPDGTLRAWTGHWIGVTSKSDIALVIPPARTSRAAIVGTGTRPSVGSGGWALRLSATVRDLRDTFNFIGTSSRAADRYDVADVMKPPMVSPYVSLGIANEGWGIHSGVYQQDLRSTGGTTKTWNLVVSTDQHNSPVTVSWSSVTPLPRNLKLTLRDELTGQVMDMRTRSAYTFHTGAEVAARRFTITARPATGGATRITNVTIRPVGSRASGTVSIGFTLSGDATYDVKILNVTGKPISTVASRSAGAGDVSLVWTGKDGAGRNVPAGTYLVQIRAVSADGESVKVVQPFVVLR